MTFVLFVDSLAGEVLRGATDGCCRCTVVEEVLSLFKSSGHTHLPPSRLAIVCGSGVESHLLTRPYRSTRRAVVEIAVDVAPLVGIAEIDILLCWRDRPCTRLRRSAAVDLIVDITCNSSDIA